MSSKIEVMDIHDKKQRQRMLLIYSGLTAAIILLEISFRDQIYSTSAEFAMYLQQNFPQTPVVWFFKFMSFFGTPSLLVPLLLILFASEAKKFLTMKVTIYLCFVGYTISVIKSIYRNPRPYWIYPSNPSLPGYVAPGIIPMEHYAEYGNPSGHAFLVTAFYGYLYYVFLYKRAVGYSGIARDERSLSLSSGSPMVEIPNGARKQATEDEEEQIQEPAQTGGELELEIQLPEQYPKEKVHQSKWYPISKALYFMLVFFVCLCRIYLGMHSLNQVLLGATLGSYSLFIIIYYVDPLLDTFFKSIRTKALENKIVIAALLLTSYIILSIIPIVIFMNNEKSSAQEWNTWWKVVQTEVNPPKFTFAHIKCFMDCGALGIGFGVVFALMASHNNYLERGLKFSALTNTAILLRILVFGLTVVLTAGLLFMIPTGENWVMRYIVNSNLAALVGAYCAIRIAPMAYAKFGLEADHYFNQPRHLHVDNAVYLV